MLRGQKGPFFVGGKSHLGYFTFLKKEKGL